MKTQRMDGRFERFKQEAKRRVDQKVLVDDNTVLAHKKLLCRAKAKSYTQRLDHLVFGSLKNLGYIEFEPIEDIKMQVVPWLYQEIGLCLSKKEDMERAVDRLFSSSINNYLETHTNYLKREENRIQSIKDREEEEKRKFDEARRIRRDIRAQKRLSKKKRLYKEEIESTVLAKRVVEQDPFKIMFVDFEDDLPFELGCRTYGGFWFELWIVLSKAKSLYEKGFQGSNEGINEKEKSKQLSKHSDEEDDFLDTPNVRNFVINLLNSPRFRDHGIRINLREDVKEFMVDSLALMHTNLFKFDEVRAERIEKILQTSSTIFDNKIIDLALQEKLLNRHILRSIESTVLEIVFKSCDYKIASKPAHSRTNINSEGDNQAQINQDGAQNPEDIPPVNTHEELQVEEDHNNYIIPEIKAEDRMIESLKTKFDIVFISRSNSSQNKPIQQSPDVVASSSQTQVQQGQIAQLNNEIPHTWESMFTIRHILTDQINQGQEVEPKYTAIGRMREALNYDEEYAKDSPTHHGGSTHHLTHSTEHVLTEEERLKREKEKLTQFGRKYLLEEFEQKILAKEEQHRNKLAEEEQARKDAYIEQYYGDKYENDMKEFPIYEADRPTTVIPAEYQQDVLFINCINQRNIREEFERKVRDQFKDKFKEHLKQNQGELNLKEMFTKVDKRAETFLLENIIGEDPNLKDRIPVFDFEL